MTLIFINVLNAAGHCKDITFTLQYSSCEQQFLDVMVRNKHENLKTDIYVKGRPSGTVA